VTCAAFLAPTRSGTVLAEWLTERDSAWRAGVSTASLDPFRGYATALATHLPQAARVLDPFHVVKLGLDCVDQVRRRIQQDTLGHRGRARDPLYDIRRVLRRRRDRLSPKARARLQAGLIAGDPTGEVALAWTVAQDLMALFQLTDPAQARRRAEQLIADLRECPIDELARLGRTLHAWQTELCAHFDHTTVSNGPSENLNLKIKHTKRIALNRPSGPGQALAVEVVVFLSRLRWRSRLAMTRAWRATSLFQLRASASARSASSSASWASSCGRNSVLVV
jgi:transposase